MFGHIKTGCAVVATSTGAVATEAVAGSTGAVSTGGAGSYSLNFWLSENLLMHKFLVNQINTLLIGCHVLVNLRLDGDGVRK